MNGRTVRVLRPAAAVAALLLTHNGALAADVFSGERIYRTHCEACHGTDGRGIAPGAPDFTRGHSLMRPDGMLLQSIRAGRNSMPGYQGVLDAYQMLDVIAYLRTLR